MKYFNQLVFHYKELTPKISCSFLHVQLLDIYQTAKNPQQDQRTIDLSGPVVFCSIGLIILFSAQPLECGHWFTIPYVELCLLVSIDRRDNLSLTLTLSGEDRNEW